MQIHYIGQYGEPNDERNLSFSPAGVTKMKYVIDVLRRIGCTVTVYSTCSTNKSFGHFYRIKKVLGNDGISYVYAATFGVKSSRIKLIELFFHQLQLLIHLLLKVNNQDIVMIYHERYYLPVIQFVKKIRKINLIYEVEEIYTLVAQYSQDEINKEISMLKIADGYLFSNDIMAKNCGFDTKPYVVSYGSYQVVPAYFEKPNDGFIHIVYAGTFNPSKGGASTAIKAAKYLPQNYHLHILGFGTEAEIDDIKTQINNISTDAKAKITYDGCLSGEEYNISLQRCDIGLSTQFPDALFNETSFPSKVLSYLANGLHVISARLDALEKSKINKLIYYYSGNSPEAIAEAIKQVKIDEEYNSRAFIMELDKDFCMDLKDMVDSFSVINS